MRIAVQVAHEDVAAHGVGYDDLGLPRLWDDDVFDESVKVVEKGFERIDVAFLPIWKQPTRQALTAPIQ